MKNLRKIVVAVLALGGLQAVQAATISFEGFANEIYGAPIVRSGFQFGNVAGDEQHFHEIDSTRFNLISNGTGVLLNDRDSRIFAKLAGGGTFLANSIDVASSGGSNNGSNLGIAIQGFLNNVSVGTVNVAFDINDPFLNVNLLSLGTVDTIVFDGLEGGFELDNATFNEPRQSVPEPGTLALLALGLFATAQISRRKVF